MIVLLALLLLAGAACSVQPDISQDPGGSGEPKTATGEQETLDELQAASATSGDQPPALLSAQQPEIEAFVETVAADVDALWAESLGAAGEAYSSPALEFVYDQPVDTGTEECGIVEESMGPLYCPYNNTVYYTVNTLIPVTQEPTATQGQYGAAQDQYGEDDQGRYIDEFGDFAVAFTVAHEMAHHVQDQLGILEAKDRGELLTIQTELQADCLAGVWANTAYYEGQLEAGEIEEALFFEASIADLPGTPVDDPGAHGGAEERQEWFLHGYDTGDGSACVTY